MFAPLLASLVGGMGLLAAVLRREGSGRPMTFRSPRPARGHPAGPGPVPRLRRPGPGRRAGTTSPPGWCWPGSRRPNDLAFFTPAEVAVAGPLLDLLLAQDGEPRVPVLALIDARLAVGETDGWHYDDLPEDGAGLAGHPRGSSTRTPRHRHGRAVRPAATGRAGGAGPGRAGPRAPRRAVARLARRAGVEPVDPLRLHRVLLPPVGVERDRLPRPGLPARLPEPRRRRPRALGGRRPRSTPTRCPSPTGSSGPARAHADLLGRERRRAMRRCRLRATSGPATSRPGCCPTTAPAPTTGCAPTCAATPTTTRSTWWSSAPAPAAAC